MRSDLSRIAQLDQRTALPDQCLHSAEADVRPPRRKSGFGPISDLGQSRTSAHNPAIQPFDFPELGATLSTEHVERRLAAILAADVAGNAAWGNQGSAAITAHRSATKC